MVSTFRVAYRGLLVRRVRGRADAPPSAADQVQLALYLDLAVGGLVRCRDKQELSVLCLRILVAALVYVNILMAPDVLAGDDWQTG